MFCDGRVKSDATDFLTFVSKVKNASHSQPAQQQQQQQQQGSVMPAAGTKLPPLSASLPSSVSLTGSSLPAFSLPSFSDSLLALPPALPAAPMLPLLTPQQMQSQAHSQQSMMFKTTFKLDRASQPKGSQICHAVHAPPAPAPTPLSLPSSILPAVAHHTVSQATLIQPHQGKAALPPAAFMGKMLLPSLKPTSAAPVMPIASPPTTAPPQEKIEVFEKKHAKYRETHNLGTHASLFHLLSPLVLIPPPLSF